MTEKPARDPLVPPDVDLREFPYFPLYFGVLFKSDTWIIGNPEEKMAALHLWCESWHQVPAGSLPDDDRLLANLSRTDRRWARLKVHALRGWFKCTDGRLYHPFVAEKALEAWHMKRNQSKRGQAGASARWSKPPSQDLFSPDASGNATGNASGIEQAMPKDGHRSEGNGTERKELGPPKKAPPGRTLTPFALPEWIGAEAWEGFEKMRVLIKKPMTDRARWLIVTELEKLHAQGHPADACLDQSSRCNWQDVFAPRDKSARPGAAGVASQNRTTASNWAGKAPDAKH